MDAAAAASCAAFNADTLAAISRLKQDRNLSGVVLAGEWAVRQPGWDRQLDQRVAALRDAGLRVIIARDVPAFPSRFMVCATRRAPSDCALDRHQVELDRASSDAVITQIAAGKADVRTWTPLDALCPAQRCMSVIARRLLYRNPTHLTLDGSAYLAPSMGAMIDWLAPKPAQGSAGASSRSPRRLGAGRRRMRTGRAGPS